MTHLACEFVETGKKPTAAVIWLHGLGASGHDFVPIVPQLQLPADMAIRFVFPHAPSIPVTINGGMVMPAWYDILSMGTEERTVDTAGIFASSQAIAALIEREIEQGIPSERIVLAGFSQGGAVCYQLGLSYDKPLAGLMLMSTYFATHSTIAPGDANKSIPIHLFHGTEDSMVPEAMAQHGKAALEALGYRPQYKNYPMAHEVHPRQIADISQWLQTVLNRDL